MCLANSQAGPRRSNPVVGFGEGGAVVDGIGFASVDPSGVSVLNSGGKPVLVNPVCSTHEDFLEQLSANLLAAADEALYLNKAQKQQR